MRYSESGGVLKQCVRCGKVMEIENFFAACATKYCSECAAQVKREKTALCLREKRRKEREQRELERQQNRLLIEENELLRMQVRDLQHSVEMLHGKVMRDGKT